MYNRVMFSIHVVPSSPKSCESYAVYNQSTGLLSGITTVWSQIEVKCSLYSIDLLLIIIITMVM